MRDEKKLHDDTYLMLIEPARKSEAERRTLKAIVGKRLEEARRYVLFSYSQFPLNLGQERGVGNFGQRDLPAYVH